MDNPPTARPSSGLRQQKVARTRRALIEAAVELCLRHGYDNTTVQQISDAVAVSARTFSRYFPSKDAVFIAVLDDLADMIAAELSTQPPVTNPWEGLRGAVVAVMDQVTARPLSGITSDRIALTLRIVDCAPTLRQAAIDYRSPRVIATLARNMGVATDDPQLDLAVALFNTTAVSACTNLAVADAEEVKTLPALIAERLQCTLGHIANYAANLQIPTAGV